MGIKSYAKIIGLGAYLPVNKLTNHDLEGMVDTSNEWIIRRTGIKERHISEKDEFASHMAIKAVENLVEKYSVSVDNVDLIIVTTFTPDHFCPTVAALVQGNFGMENCGTFDLISGCTGFVYGLSIADALITSGHNNKVLVIASETVSKVVDYKDRNSCILFGDAAVAVLIERNEEKGSFLASNFYTEGKLGQYVTCNNLSDNINGHIVDKKRTFDQEGRFLYEYVLKNIPGGVYKLLEKTNLSLTDIDWFVPHSANLRMITAICEKLDFPMDKTLTSVENYGNTSSVTIPLALWIALNENRLNSGDRLVLYGFGAGLSHGGVVIEW